MISVEKRQQIERRVVRSLAVELIDAGYVLSVNDGEEVHQRTTNVDTILEQVFAVDESHIHVHASMLSPNSAMEGWFYIVLGNDGWDAICDYTTNLDGKFPKTESLIDVLSGE